MNLTSLIDARDEIFVAKNMLVAAYMAAQALDPAGAERGAMCAVINVAREMLETALDRLDEVIAAPR